MASTTWRGGRAGWRPASCAVFCPHCPGRLCWPDRLQRWADLALGPLPLLQRCCAAHPAPPSPTQPWTMHSPPRPPAAPPSPPRPPASSLRTQPPLRTHHGWLTSLSAPVAVTSSPLRRQASPAPSPDGNPGPAPHPDASSRSASSALGKRRKKGTSPRLGLWPCFSPGHLRSVTAAAQQAVS